MTGGPRVFVTLLGLPGAARTVAPGLLARCTFAMAGLSIVLDVHARTGSFSRAGLAAGAYGLAGALAGPVWGRRADRMGPRRALAPAAALYPVLFTAMLLVPARSLVLLGVVAAAGLVVPQVGAAARAAWPAFTDDPGLLAAAYNLESVMVEVCFTVGPLLVAGLTAWQGPAAAVLATAVATGVGALGFLSSPALRPVPAASAVPAGSPLRSTGVRAVLSVTLAVSAVFGALEVAVPAVTSARGSAALGGVLLGLYAVGSILGGLAYGSVLAGRRARRAGGDDSPGDHGARSARRWMGLQIAFFLTLLPVASAPGTVLLGLALLVNGACIAPAGTETFALAARATPAGTVTETFTWLTTVMAVGGAVGSAAAGALQSTAGGSAALELAAGFGLLAGVLAVAGHRSAAGPAPIPSRR